jgi:glycosyltransferase involved in cell wall biosynthesis
MRHPEHDFVLVGDGPCFEHFRVSDVSFYNVGQGNPFKNILSLFMNFWLTLFSRPKVIVGLAATKLVPIAIASIIIRGRLVLVITNDLWYTVSSLPQIARGPFRLILRASLNRSSAILAVSESIKRELIEDYGIRRNKVVVYKYAVSNIFNPNVPQTLRDELNPHGPIVLAVSRFDRAKGLEYLVRASPAVIRRIGNVKFVIRAYSSYSSDKKYERHIIELIRQLGLQEYFDVIIEYVPYREMPKRMVAADVFVLPSISEGLGLVVLEAMASGVPVICSKVGGIVDMVSDSINGLLVEPGDVNALSEAIIRLLSDADLRKKLSRTALATVQDAEEHDFESSLTRSMLLNH